MRGGFAVNKAMTLLAGILAGIVLVTEPAQAEGPGIGTKQRAPYMIKGRDGDMCHAYTITARWNLDSLLGTATVNGSWKWTGSGECEAHLSTAILLKVQARQTFGFVKITPVVPDVNKGYGYNTTGAYDWDELVCSYSGTRVTSCFDAETAKALWKHGAVVDFVVVWD